MIILLKENIKKKKKKLNNRSRRKSSKRIKHSIFSQTEFLRNSKFFYFKSIRITEKLQKVDFGGIRKPNRENGEAIKKGQKTDELRELWKNKES